VVLLFRYLEQFHTEEYREMLFFMLYSSISPPKKEIASLVHLGIDASKRGSCGRVSRAIRRDLGISRCIAYRAAPGLGSLPASVLPLYLEGLVRSS
jgi:hypothetical protein